MFGHVTSAGRVVFFLSNNPCLFCAPAINVDSIILGGKQIIVYQNNLDQKVKELSVSAGRQGVLCRSKTRSVTNKTKTKQNKQQQQNWSISGQMLVLRLNDSGYRSETESEMLSNRLLCGGDKQDKNRSRCLACRTMGSLRSSADTGTKTN